NDRYAAIVPIRYEKLLELVSQARNCGEKLLRAPRHDSITVADEPGAAEPCDRIVADVEGQRTRGEIVELGQRWAARDQLAHGDAGRVNSYRQAYQGQRLTDGGQRRAQMRGADGDELSDISAIRNWGYRGAAAGEPLQVLPRGQPAHAVRHQNDFLRAGI